MQKQLDSLQWAQQHETETHKDVELTRTFGEASAATADNGEYDEQYDHTRSRLW